LEEEEKKVEVLSLGFGSLKFVLDGRELSGEFMGELGRWKICKALK
jgi:hypothetical protein